MSDTEFKASNGRTVTTVDSCYRVSVFQGKTNLLDDYNFLNRGDLEALAEYIQHNRDEELGRWRWPEHPKYVVYLKEPDAGGCIRDFRVVNEETGRSRDVSRSVVQQFGSPSQFGEAVEAYLAAHPEPEPWKNAKEGEVWLITSEHRDNEPAVVKGQLFHFAEGRDYIDSPIITAARRIYPEGEDK